ncbi:autophagy-related protein 9 [Xylogone sp. PMI_703]|nr:autophagy-related protein 9 [Xylogone sp. PMI_703]
MVGPNILSRILPSNPAGRSIYDELQAHDDAYQMDIEERAAMAVDEENLRFQDEELGNVDALNLEDSRLTTESTAFLRDQHTSDRTPKSGKGKGGKGRSRSFARSPRLLEEDPGDDDIPASLLIEEGADGLRSPEQQKGKQRQSHVRHASMQEPSTRETRAHWESAQAQQRLHQDEVRNTAAPQPGRQNRGIMTGTPRDKAMWHWATVVNLDNFLNDVYDYYTKNGMWCILLQEILNLFILIFVAVLTVFLTQCVDYNKIPHSKKMSQVLVPKCTTKISGMPNVAIWLLSLYVIYRVYALVADIPRLIIIRNFYTHLLEVPDSDMQTISWQDIVARIMALRDANPITAQKMTPSVRKFMGNQSKERLDAHDIANRLMRKENYLIAMINKEILDLSVPLPFFQGRQLFSRTVKWTIEYSILDFLFNKNGHVRQLVLKDSHRRQLSQELRNRFLFAGFMNIIGAPFIVVYLMIVYFLKYFNEYQKNPSALGSRQYTPLAEWKFREFNELHHLFHKRINMSYPFASRYLDQFPKVKTVQLARFIAFIAGAVTSVLAITTLWDPELFLGFEITPERTVLFYVTIFGSIWAATNGMIPDENLVFEPEYALRNVIEYTHYMPNHWQDRLHSDEVKREFSGLYELRIMVFLEEILSILVTPLILWFSLPKCSDQIIDFFREFTIHVDGVGYVCSFAVFDFKKGVGRPGRQSGANADMRDDYYSTKHGKMAASYYGFLDNYFLNPKTGVPGHMPPRPQQQFHPPPAFPGLMSSALGGDMQASRMGRNDRRTGNRAPNMPQTTARTPRFAPTAGHGSMIGSILLDPHHQPTTSSIGGMSIARNSRSRYQNIIEEPVEDEDRGRRLDPSSSGETHGVYESALGLGESRWETSPVRGAGRDIEDNEEDGDGDGATGPGVLGLLYQFQKAQTDGRGIGI